jgi:predicted Zn-dependent peptidase
MVYARVPTRIVQTALNVMTTWSFAPAFSDLDAEREVVLEEIAMYEDTPQELVTTSSQRPSSGATRSAGR